jgi:hypothetical protein
VLPRRQVHIGEADFDLAADLTVAIDWQVVVRVEVF